MSFRGTFEHSLDAKNRLTVPAKFRNALHGEFVIARSIEPCVSLWTKEAFETFTRRYLADLHPMSAEAGRMSRFFNGGSFDGELDSAGRVMIPTALIDRIGLKKEVVVVGNNDRLEIWDREKWLNYDDELTSTLNETVESIVNPA